MQITKLTTNWFTSNDGHESGEEFTEYEVGKKGVVDITEHRRADPNDKWFYNITFEGGGMKRIFNPDTVLFAGE